MDNINNYYLLKVNYLPDMRPGPLHLSSHQLSEIDSMCVLQMKKVRPREVRGCRRPHCQSSGWSRDFQPFSSHGTHKLLTKILQHTKKCILFFANLTKKIGVIMVHSQWIATVVLSVVIFYLAI